MIFSTSVESFYEKHRKEVLKLVAAEHYKRTDIKDLKYVFTSASGAIYYKIPAQMEQPVARLGKNQDLITLLMTGLSEEDITLIIETVNKEMALAYNGKEFNALKIGALLSELDFRAKNFTHFDLLIQLVATNLIRHDENPAIINADIFQEKTDDIEAECLAGNTSFFFQVEQLSILNEIQNMSQSELTTYLASLQEGLKIQKEKLKVLLSEKGLENVMKTSTVN